MVGHLHCSPRVRLRSPLLIVAGIVVLFACGAPLRQDELDCEEAVSVLASCCPGFQSSQLQCIYDDPGCGGTTYPALTLSDSACIRSETCATLVSSGVCSRAQMARGYVLGDPNAPDETQPPPVCP
jgi:hypothetical protein